MARNAVSLELKRAKNHLKLSEAKRICRQRNVEFERRPARRSGGMSLESALSFL